MAIVKFIPARKPQSTGGLYGSMEYCKQAHKTWDDVTRRHLVTGINCVASTAYREFMNTNRFYEKTGGRMYYHVVQSFSPEEELTAETAHEIALKLAEQFSGFEVLVCTHTDRDHLHSHLIINSVSAEDGRKYHSDKDNIQRIRMASDKLCMQYGLSVVKPKQKRTPGMSAAEYRSADRGESWKLRLAIAIDDAMAVARTRAHFLELMEMEGYRVRWEKDRKYITYTTPEGKQCRDIRLHEAKYVKENMEREFRIRKGSFPAIVTEEEWHQAQAIKESRVKQSFKTDAKVPVHGTKENHDLWGSKMQCSCGCSFRKNRWHKNENSPWSYGYQCHNILNNGSGKKRREAGADDTGYCDQPMIADWKLELMGQKILEQVFGEQRELIQYTIDLIRQCYRSQKPAETSLTNITARMERIKRKKETLLDMRTDGEITKEEFLSQRQKLDTELQSLTTEYETLSHPNVTTLEQPEWGKIQDALEEILDLSQPKPSPDLIRKFVTKIVPDGKTNFHWYMNLDGTNTTIQDMTVEGRKNKAVVTLCQAEADDTPDPRRVIHLQTIQTMSVFPSPLVMPHRLLSRTEGFERLPQVRNFHCDH